MRKINYNLARFRKIDTRAFALIVAVILLAAIIFNAITIFNLASQHRQSRNEKKEIRFAALKLEKLQQKTLRWQKEIAVWKKTWAQKLAFANALIERKCFSFIFRLNFLEKICSAGLRVRRLSIGNDPAGRMQMTVDALVQNELLGLYKKLLPYELVISSENQTAENYRANLGIKIKNEKK
jgi:cell division protein FtsL